VTAALDARAAAKAIPDVKISQIEIPLECYTTGSSDFDGAFHVLLTLDFPEIKLRFSGSCIRPTID
jgi:hypothetical protein